MGRLESTKAAGYFPSPATVVTSVARHLSGSARGGRQRVRLLDPCAGTGAAAAQIAQALEAESFGIEINEERAEAARGLLDRVLATSAFSVRLANGAFSLLYLNPPYDADDEKRRLEHAFLTSMSRALCPGGLMVFIIPQRRLAVSARYLASHYAGFRVYRFPDPEFTAYRQIVLFASKRSRPLIEERVQAQLEAWSAGELPPLPDAPPADLPPITVPAVPAGEVLFASLFFDPAQAAAEARQRGVWVQPQLADQLWPPDERPVRPLMPLRKGHLALLIAAGLLNNVVLGHEGQRVLVKGRTYKEVVPVESADEDIEIEREVLRTSLMALDMNTGALQVIDQHGAAAGEERRAA